MPAGRVKTLAPVRPNAGLEQEYKRRVTALIDEMHRSMVYWLRAAMRRREPEVVKLFAEDDAPAREIGATLNRLKRRWQRRFDQAAVELAEYFATAAADRSDAALRSILRRGGFSVRFRRTRAVNDVLQATVAENVSLIKSISQQYLSQVEGMVMRSVQQGRDFASLANELEDQLGVTRRRAAFIARDQNNKATATVQRVRQAEIGIKEAVWVHSGGGRYPRPTHVKAGRDKVRYDISVGWYDPGEKKRVFPGELINCLPGWSVVASAGGCKKLWRRWYSGQLTQVVTDTGETLEATPNHPVLTRRGWAPIKSIDLGEDIFKVSDEIGFGIKPNVEGHKSSIAEIFDTATLLCRPDIADGCGWFHGDTADSEVYVVDIDGLLPHEIDAALCKKILELLFSNPDEASIRCDLDARRPFDATLARLFGPPESVVRGLGTLLALLRGHPARADRIGLRLISDMNTRLKQAATDHPAINAVLARHLKLAHSGFVIGDDQVIREVFGVAGRASRLWNGDAPSAKMLGNGIGVMPDSSSGVLQEHAFANKLGGVIEKRSIDFSGHVFNLETFAGHYTANSAITQNCRCVAKPVVPGFS